jgi:hypothetical protein
MQPDRSRLLKEHTQPAANGKATGVGANAETISGLEVSAERTGTPQGGTVLKCQPRRSNDGFAQRSRRAAGAAERSDIWVRFGHATVCGPELDRWVERRLRREARPSAANGLGDSRDENVAATGSFGDGFSLSMRGQLMVQTGVRLVCRALQWWHLLRTLTDS